MNIRNNLHVPAKPCIDLQIPASTCRSKVNLYMAGLPQPAMVWTSVMDPARESGKRL
jgi:hypothetical protein